MKAIITHVEAGLIATNSQGQLTVVNPTARQLHGYDESTEPDIDSLIAQTRGFYFILFNLL